MAWTTTIKDKRKEGGKLYIFVEFDNNGVKVTDTFAFDGDSLEGLKARVAAKIARLDAVDALDGLLTVGQVVDVTPSPVAPTAKELWFADWNRLVFANQLVSAGIVASNNPQYVALKNKVIADFNVSYV